MPTVQVAKLKISREDKQKQYYTKRREALITHDKEYTAFKKVDAERARLYRQNLCDDKKKRNAERSKLRMRAMRQRRKENNAESNTKIVTRHERAKLREKWRDAKTKQRSNLTPQAKRRVLERRRERYKTKVHERKLDRDIPETLKRQSPETFAASIDHIISNVTPKKRAKLKESGTFLTPKSKKRNATYGRIVQNLKKSLKYLKEDKSKQGRSKYHWMVKAITNKSLKDSQMRKCLELQHHFWRSASLLEDDSLPPRWNGISENQQQGVADVYNEESTTLPLRRTVTAKGLSQKCVLNKTTAQLHSEFLAKNAGKLSLSKFRKLRPKHCLTVTNNKFNSCLCEYCLNVELNLKTLNEAMRRKGLVVSMTDKYQVSKASMCERREDFNDKDCIERNCSLCGVGIIKGKFSALLDTAGETEVTWQKWETQDIKDKNGKLSKRKVLVKKIGSVAECVDDLCRMSVTLARHLFTAYWQRQQFKQLKSSLPSDWLLTVADFAENYRCSYQDEVQSAYFMYQQATVHPMLAYYKCPTCSNAIVEESAVFISPDLQHDAHAVRQFSEHLTDHIKLRGANVVHEVQFSDGCSSQYKSKVPFQHVSERGVEGHTFERAYFGSGHGKGPCDALGGIVKKAAEVFVRSRQGLVRNAQELYEFCRGSMVIDAKDDECLHKRRVFFYENDILRPEEQKTLQTLKGTQQMHSVRSIDNKGIVEARRLSCFCESCTGINAESTCNNQNYIDDWQKHTIEKSRMGRQRQRKTKSSKPKSRTTARSAKQPIPAGMESQAKRKTARRLHAEASEYPHKSRKKEQQASTQTGSAYTPEFLQKVFRCKSFKTLQTLAKRITKSLPTLMCESPRHSVLSLGKVVDKASQSLKPDDISEELATLYPVTIYGDGNCLARCGSLLAYGTEEKHPEIRARIALELAGNKAFYLKNSNLEHGASLGHQDDIAKSFAIMSQYFGTGDTLSVSKIFEKEAVGSTKVGEYMGLWQIASLSSVLQRQVYSVYPKYGGHNVRNDINRVFIPRLSANGDPVHIMWTNTTGKELSEVTWTANHFSLLLPLTSREDNDISFDSSMPDMENDEDIDSFIRQIEDLLDNEEIPDTADPASLSHIIPSVEKPARPRHFFPDLEEPGSSHDFTSDKEEPGSAHDFAPDKEEPGSAQDFTPGLEDQGSSYDFAPDKEEPGSAHDFSPDLEDQCSAHDVAPDKEEPGGAHDFTPDLEDQCSAHYFTPDLEEPGCVHDFTPDKEEPGSSRDFAPDKEEPGSSPDFNPDIEEPVSSHDFAPYKEEPGSSHDFTPNQEEPSSSHVFTPYQEEPGSAHDFTPYQEEPSSSHVFTPDNEEQGSSHDYTPDKEEPEGPFPASHVTDEPSSTLARSPRLTVGSYAAIHYGAQLLPAVIVEAPCDLGTQESGAWVNYFKPKFGAWILNDTPFFIDHEEISHMLDPPDVRRIGRFRSIFNFNLD